MKGLSPRRGQSFRLLWIAVILSASGGCHTQLGTTRRASDPPLPAEMSLADVFGRPAPTTQPARVDKINPDAMLAYMAGRSALVAGQYDQAAEHFGQALKHDPSYLLARRTLTKLHFDRGQWVLARRQAEKLLEYDRKSVIGHYVLGSILIRTKPHFQMAGTHLYQAIVLAEQSGQGDSEPAILSRSQLGQALAGREHFRAAIEVYRPLLDYLDRLDSGALPRNPKIRQLHQAYRPALTLLVAGFWCKLKNPDRAETWYLRAQRFPAVARRARLGMIRCYHNAGRGKKARELLDQLAAADPVDNDVLGLYRQVYPDGRWIDKLLAAYVPSERNVQVGVTLARELIRSERVSEAANLLEALIKAAPGHDTVLYLAVTSYQQLDQMDRCATLLIDSLAAGNYAAANPIGFADRWDPPLCKRLADALNRVDVPDDREFARTYLRGLIAQVRGKRSRAAAYYGRAYELNDTFVPGYLAEGNLLLLARQWSAALDVIDRALSKAPATAALLFVKGQALAELDRLDEAIAVLQQAKQLNARSDRVLLALAEAHLRNNRPTPALELFKQAVKSEFASREVRAELVQVLIDADVLPMADEVLERYRRQFGKDGLYTLLSADIAYHRQADADAYRTILQSLIGKTIRPGLAEIELAELAYETGDHHQAIVLADRILTDHDDLWPRDYRRILELKGFAHRRLLQFDRAEQTWKRLLDDWPNQYTLHALLGAGYLDRLEFAQAEKVFTDLLGRQTDPQRKLQLQQQIAAARLGAGDLPGATELISAWVRDATGAHRVGLRQLLLGCYLVGKQYDAAAKWLDFLLTADPSRTRQWRQAQVLVMLKQGRAGPAIDTIDGWLEKADAKQRPFLEGLKIPVYVKLKQFDRAQPLAHARWQSAEGHEKLARALVLIHVYHQAGRFNEAEQFIREQIKDLDPDSPRIMDFQQRLVRTWHLAGKIDQAETFILKRMPSAPDPVRGEWRQWLVRLYSAAGQTDKAIELLETIVAENPDLPWANNSLGYTLADKDQDRDRAEQLIRRALAAEPNNYAYLDSLAWAVYRKGDLTAARTFLNMALRLLSAPHLVAAGYLGGIGLPGGATEPDPVILDHLGDVEAALNRVDQARKYWQEALKVSQEFQPIDLEANLRPRILEKLKFTTTTTAPK